MKIRVIDTKMRRFNVCEKFVSINGEGPRAGQLAVFIRFKGCNLSCSYCDTRWANAEDAPYTALTADEICGYIKSTGVKNVTLTGGEPLLRDGIDELLKALKEKSCCVEVETNGAVDLRAFCDLALRPRFTMDYKLPSSGMKDKMILTNFELLGEDDCVKFVTGSDADLRCAKGIIDKYDLTNRCGVYLSPVFGRIEPARIVEFMTENKMNDVNLQIQIHKVIWDPDMRGV